jgi:uncharacterized protein YecE (DUF72 family)
MTHQIRIGTAGWSVSRALEGFPEAGTSLERYAARFNAVEINSSFYRPHRRKTYERWAASTPADFRFAVKAPKTLTHERRLVDCGEPLARFLDECAGLGDRLGPLLIQLPPSLGFERAVAARFLADWRSATAGATVVEPRHASWFTPAADALFERFEIVRVAADPAVVPDAAWPGGWRGLAYRRLHGSPVMYDSPYPAETLDTLAKAMVFEAQRGPTWCIFDNTRLGAATVDALKLASRVAR